VTRRKTWDLPQTLVEMCLRALWKRIPENNAGDGKRLPHLRLGPNAALRRVAATYSFGPGTVHRF
jgi:hypothetical protein